MKYWNKRPNVMRSGWTQIKVNDSLGQLANYDTWEYYAHGAKKMKLWCQRQPGRGRFYYYCGTWWFEDRRDAVLFSLNWS